MKHLYFSKRERSALILLLTLLCLIQLASLVVSMYKHNNQEAVIVMPIEREEDNKLIKEERKIDAHKQQRNSNRVVNEYKQQILMNALNEEMLRSHGLPEKLIKAWLNFAASGANFYSKSDVLNVYGMTEELYNDIEPFIVYGKKVTSKEEVVFNEANTEEINVFIEPSVSSKKNTNLIDINSADPKQLQLLNGIGPVLSNRIVKYRDMIGGFHEMDQLKAVYGLRSTLFDSIKVDLRIDKDTYKKYNIYTASEKELADHFFISDYLAKRIKQITNSRYTRGYSRADIIAELKYDTTKLTQAMPYLDFTRPEEVRDQKVAVNNVLPDSLDLEVQNNN